MKYFPEYTKANELHEILKRKLETFREYLGYPATITSGYCSTGHSENSEHYSKDGDKPCSQAADISTKAPLWWALLCAERAGFENIGVYPAFNGLHLGIRGNENRRWIGKGVDSSQEYVTWCIDNLASIMGGGM